VSSVARRFRETHLGTSYQRAREHRPLGIGAHLETTPDACSRRSTVGADHQAGEVVIGEPAYPRLDRVQPLATRGRVQAGRHRTAQHLGAGPFGRLEHGGLEFGVEEGEGGETGFQFRRQVTWSCPGHSRDVSMPVPQRPTHGR
jgi:hypothetical protein